MNKKYPDPYRDFGPDQIGYGSCAPVVGFGTFTRDKEFSWPDRQCTTKSEYEKWAKHLRDTGYDVPEKYLNAYVTPKI